VAAAGSAGARRLSKFRRDIATFARATRKANGANFYPAAGSKRPWNSMLRLTLINTLGARAHTMKMQVPTGALETRRG
jgi:DNA-directed RNA polymerase subunit K/omega